MSAVIKRGETLTHCKNILVYHNEFSKYIKVEVAKSEDVFDYLFYVGVGKILLEKENKYLYELFEKWDLEHLQLNEDFDDYLNNDVLENIIVDEGIQISMWMTSLVNIKCSKKLFHHYCDSLSSIK